MQVVAKLQLSFDFQNPIQCHSALPALDHRLWKCIESGRQLRLPIPLRGDGRGLEIPGLPYLIGLKTVPKCGDPHRQSSGFAVGTVERWACAIVVVLPALRVSLLRM